MVVMRVGDQFFLTGSTRWEASLASVHQKLDEPGWDGTATPISVDSARTRCTGQAQATSGFGKCMQRRGMFRVQVTFTA